MSARQKSTNFFSSIFQYQDLSSCLSCCNTRFEAPLFVCENNSPTAKDEPISNSTKEYDSLINLIVTPAVKIPNESSSILKRRKLQDNCALRWSAKHNHILNSYLLDNIPDFEVIKLLFPGFSEKQLQKKLRDFSEISQNFEKSKRDWSTFSSDHETEDEFLTTDEEAFNFFYKETPVHLPSKQLKIENVQGDSHCDKDQEKVFNFEKLQADEETVYVSPFDCDEKEAKLDFSHLKDFGLEISNIFQNFDETSNDIF